MSNSLSKEIVILRVLRGELASLIEDSHPYHNLVIKHQPSYADDLKSYETKLNEAYEIIDQLIIKNEK